MDINRFRNKKPTVHDVLRRERNQVGALRAFKGVDPGALAKYAQHLDACEEALARNDTVALMTELIAAIETRYAALTPALGRFEQAIRGSTPHSESKRKALDLYREHQPASTDAFKRLLLEHGIRATPDQLKKWRAAAKKPVED